METVNHKSRLRNAPLVSVVIPVHNGAAFIGTALDSVLKQNVPLEIIIIDDGSTDELEAVLKPYTKNSSIRFIKNRRNIGVAESRNKGVRAASGQFIAFLDCDDWWEPMKLKKQLCMIEKTGYVLCATARRLVTPDGEKTDQIISVKNQLTYRDLIQQNPVNCSSVLVRREVALEFPMAHDDCHEDYIMWLQITKRYGHICAVNEPLLNYRLSTTGKSGNKLQSARMTYMVYRYMGFGIIKSTICFIAYAYHGVKKYYLHR